MKKKYFFIILFIIIVPTCLFSQQYWLQQPCPTTKYLTRVQFLDTLFGWAAGDSGAVIHTTNGGQNWVVQQTGINAYIDDMYFIDRLNGWAIGNDYGPSGSYFIRTTNGGNNWNPILNPDTTNYFLTIYFLNQFTGFTGGFGGNLFRTTNSGSNWTKCNVDSSVYITFPLRRIKFFNSQFGIGCGGHYDYAGLVWVTTNGGINWRIIGISSEPEFAIKILSTNKIILTGGDFEYGTSIVTSTDQGNTWRYDTTGCYGIGRAIAFRTPSEVWVPLSYSQRWAVNIDSGASGHWFCIPAPDSTAVYDADFESPTFGWAVGCRGFLCTGSLLKYNTALIGISQNGDIVPGKIQLYQNYPNPFNSSTIIKYYLPKIADVEIKLYDAAGREVKSIVQNNISTGYHSIIFNAENFASGVYFYRITSGDYSEFKKMVLIK
jgi:photosystem II stability/assembly factor-like uncharacterized protein